jgi:hypothetical protein
LPHVLRKHSLANITSDTRGIEEGVLSNIHINQGGKFLRSTERAASEDRTIDEVKCWNCQPSISSASFGGGTAEVLPDKR